MTKISARLQSLLKKDLSKDPFTFEFDSDKMRRAENWEADEMALIEQICNFNLVFLSAIKNILETLRHHGFKKSEIIAGLFAKGNKHFAIVTRKVHHQISSLDQAVDFDRMRYLQIEDYKGNPQNGMQSIEYLSELYGLLLTYQEEYSILTQEHIHDANKRTHDIDIVLQYLIQMVNIIFNVKIAYNLIVYAEVEVDHSDTKHLKLSAEDSAVNILTTINETRSGSHFNEIFFPLYQTIKSYPANGVSIDKISVNKGEIYIKLKSGKIDRIHEAAHIAKIMAFYEYLETVKLEAFEDYLVEDLLKLTGILSDLATYDFKPEIKLESEFDDIPYKIKRQDLISYLCTMTQVSKPTVELFITSLTNPKGGEIDFFLYPLYAVEEDIYLLFSALNAPHSHPLVERWLKLSGISEENRTLLFCDHVMRDLTAASKTLRKGIKWNVGPKPPGLANNEICLETRDQLIIISCQVFRFTGNKKQEVNLLGEYEMLFTEFEERLIALQPYALSLNKRIVPICVTSDVHYSGIILKHIPILDLVLFKNYMVLGQFLRVKMINDPKRPKIRSLYDYQYYSNQDEFEIKLINFMYRPYPMQVVLQKMEFKQAALLPPELEIQISYYVPEMISEVEEEQEDLDSLDHLLKAQLFINDSDPEYNQLVHNILSKTFNKLADRRQTNLDQIPAFIDKIATSNRISATHLVIYLRRGVESMKQINKIKPTRYKPVEYDAKEILGLYTRIFESAGGNAIQLSEFKLKISLADNEQQQLITSLIDQLSNIGQRIYNLEEQEQILINLAIMGALVKKTAEISLFFQAYGNFVESLNFTQDYQKARDAAYEAWLYSQKIGKPVYGLNILFKCYIKQKNFLFAGVYGGILLSGLDSISEIDKQLFLEVLFNLFRYFREFNYWEFAKTVWKIAQKEKLDPYDDQKFSIAYFNLRLTGGLKGDRTLISAVTKYLNKNLKAIINFGRHSAIPWLGLCLNLQKHSELRQIELPEKIDQVIAELEKTIDDATIVDNLNIQIGGKSKNFKDKFIRMLIKVYSNLYYSDYKFNVINLRPIADNAFRQGFSNKDFDLILLSSLVYNDQQLNFTDHDPKQKAMRFNSELSRLDPEILKNYSKYLVEQLNLSPGQLFLWLVELNQQVYLVRITSDKTIYVDFLDTWNPSIMDRWIRIELPRFYFNSIKSKYYDLAEQEQSTAKLVRSLGAFDVQITLGFEELLILKSVDMAGYPDNLMINNGQLLSRSTPICNILNIEHYLKHQGKTLVRFDKLNAWLPKVGKDGTISFGHDDLSPLLTGFNANVIDEAILMNMPEGNINIFMAHGNTGLDGFKSFQSEEDKYQFNFNMFGTGEIAILFICNSGNLRDDFLSQDIKSVGQELIKQGYDAVIAPFWKYDVTMARIWLTEFFKVFQEGYSLNQTVHLSNRKVAEYDPETGRFFDEPGGWAAMHLYGNPNLYFSK